MATVNLQASMPRLELVGGMKLRLTAISPTTGAVVTGVTASIWSVYGLDLSDEPDVEETALEVLVVPQGG